MKKKLLVQTTIFFVFIILFVLLFSFSFSPLSLIGPTKHGCSDCVDYETRVFKSTGSIEYGNRDDRNAIWVGGDEPGIDCLANLPDYQEIREDITYVWNQELNILTEGYCSKNTNCIDIKYNYIKGGENILYVDGNEPRNQGAFYYNKPRQYPSCVLEIEDFARANGFVLDEERVVIVDNNITVYVCPDSTQVYSVEECPDAIIFQQPSLWQRIVTYLEELFNG